MMPVGFVLAVDKTRSDAQSALPNAPVVTDDRPRERTTAPVRRWRVSLASALRSLAARADAAAERVEPVYPPSCARS